jgi:hypothetical protein
LTDAGKRYFSIEQANLVISVIRPVIARILEIRQDILDKQPEVWPVVSKTAGNGGSKAASLIVQEFARLDELVNQVQASGAILKDINLGLVDFLSIDKDREIFLCWQYGEEDLAFWHEIEAGFNGRQPISSLND